MEDGADAKDSVTAPPAVSAPPAPPLDTSVATSSAVEDAVEPVVDDDQVRIVPFCLLLRSACVELYMRLRPDG